jgi:hypothetical protein
MSCAPSVYVRVLLASAALAIPSLSPAQGVEDKVPAGSAMVISDAIDAAAAVEAGRMAAVRPPSVAKRPPTLPALYVAFAALQAADAVTTFRALSNGAREANPLMAGLAGNRSAMLAVKAGSVAGTVYLSERLWRKNRTAAVVMMVCLNSAYAAIAAHNYRAGSVRR